MEALSVQDLLSIDVSINPLFPFGTSCFVYWNCMLLT